ncbi:MAG: hypothetical protein ACREEY_17825, partial [Brevundimonas sp.]
GYKAKGLPRRFDRDAAIRRASEVGVNAAARELGMHACQISRWRRAAGLPALGASSATGRSQHPASFVKATIRLAKKQGVMIAASRQEVRPSTVRRWLGWEAGR